MNSLEDKVCFYLHGDTISEIQVVLRLAVTIMSPDLFKHQRLTLKFFENTELMEQIGQLSAYRECRALKKKPKRKKDANSIEWTFLMTKAFCIVVEGRFSLPSGLMDEVFSRTT